jgi:aminopeptidase-like protein
MEHLKQALEELFKFDRQLIGPGYDNALEYLNHLLPLETLSFPSGQELGTWKVPDEWTPREAWVKFRGEKIIDFAKDPLSLVVYSLPFKGTITKEELVKHLHFDDDFPEATPYVFKFYDRDWGFCVPKNFLKSTTEDPEKPGEFITADLLEEGEYEVFIDADHKPGLMKIGVHTIPGKSDREILFFAHLDHPHQANDNLSGVVALLDIAQRLKPDHTMKFVFCPETIGSQAYAYTQDLSKVDFVIAIDICGNDNSIMLQKSWDNEHRLNRVAHCALQMAGKQYRKGKFRTSIGSDETVFNDPLIGIPGLLLTTWPYDEYHTNLDTPEKINYDKIQETAELVMKIVEIYEKDYVPERDFKGPLMRSRYELQSPVTRVNLIWDYLVYSMDGKKYLSELCADSEMNFDYVYNELEKVIKDGKIKRGPTARKSRKQATPRKK